MKTLALCAPLALIAAPALAHTGHGDAAGLVDGLVHPVLGMDHLLAMVTVGLWSGLVMPQAAWRGAATFVAAMAAGIGLGWAGAGFASVEQVILLSVVAFGVLVLLSCPEQPRALTLASLVGIGLFALAHGHVHATEAAGGGSGYLAGVLMTTTALHLAGLILARAVAAGSAARLLQRMLGGSIAAAGLILITG